MRWTLCARWTLTAWRRSFLDFCAMIPPGRARALEISAQQNLVADIKEVEPLLRDSDDEVRMHAAYFFCILTPGDPRESMGGLLQSDNEKIRSGAFQCVSAHSPKEEDEKVDTMARQFLERGAPGDRLAVAMGAGRRPAPARIHEHLMTLIDDSDRSVRRAAIRSAGAAKHRDLVPNLLRLLERPEFREDAEHALVQYGDSVLGTLGDYLGDPAVAEGIRTAIPAILSRIGSQDATNALLRVLLDEDPAFSDRLLRALWRIKTVNPEVNIREGEIAKRISLEVGQYRSFHRCRRTLEQEPAGQARDLLVRILWERTGQSLRRLFWILALVYPRGETRLAYRGLISNNVRLRAQAIEYVESVLSPEHRRIVVPIVEETRGGGGSGGGLKGIAGKRPGAGSSLAEVLNELAGVPDPWLIAGTLYAVGSLNVTSLKRLAISSARAEHPYVREMGRWASDSLAAAEA